MYFFWFYLIQGLGLLYYIVLTVLVCGVQPISLRLVAVLLLPATQELELKEYGTLASQEEDLDVLAHLCNAIL